MANTFINYLGDMSNYEYTENGAVKRLSTKNPVYDLFVFGAAYRSRSNNDVILLFKNAFEENEILALKCLFYLRDCRGGQGERRFFRVCMKWLAENYPDRIRHLIKYIPEYGRYDDLFALFDTSLEKDVIDLIKKQLTTDMASNKNGISLIAKWLPSENASNAYTIAKARKIRKAIGITAKDYRKMLSKLREKIKVLEKLMSANRWEEIEFDKIPSRAGMIYANAFARRDIIAKKYEEFIKNKNTKVNANVLYPYEVVSKALKHFRDPVNSTERMAINKYWENLPDYLEGKDCSMLCVVDTSGSMIGSNAAAPINVAISLGMYCAERIGYPFKNHYISFSSEPQFIKIEGVDFVDKAQRIFRSNLCDNTNLEAVFDLILNSIKYNNVKKEDIPKTLVVISDMEIDAGTSTWIWSSTKNRTWTKENAETDMERIRQSWKAMGYELPRLVYWNVDARHNTILDSGPNVSFVSGMSPVIFKSILTGKNGWDLCLETIMSDRYNDIE